MSFEKVLSNKSYIIVNIYLFMRELIFYYQTLKIVMVILYSLFSI